VVITIEEEPKEEQKTETQERHRPFGWIRRK